MRAQFEASPPMRLFTEQLDLNTDWSARDTADVYAFSTILLWLAIDDAQRTSAATDNAVRADICASMAAAPAVWKASDAEQQELAERVASWTTVLIGQYNSVVQLGDARPAAVPAPEEFRETLIELGRSRHLFGVDLSEVKLTRKGVVPR